MKRNSIRPYLFLLIVLLFLLSLSSSFVEKLRGKAISSFASFSGNHFQLTEKDEINRLRLENQFLSQEITRLQELFQLEQTLNSRLSNFYSKVTANEESEKLL